MCKCPFGTFSCQGYGQRFCLICLIRRRGIWTLRCLVESFLHSNNSFVTLTYDEQFMPIKSERGVTRRGTVALSSTGEPLIAEGLPTVLTEDVQKWLKRLRKRGIKIRYYGCAEYGDRTWRPHYHFILFGYPTCVNPPPAGMKRIAECECQPCTVIRETWSYGFTDVRICEPKSIQYVAGYVTKKMTKKGDSRLKGRNPERSFTSRRPGVGADAARVVAEALTSNEGADEILALGDVPSVLRVGGRVYPMGRYLKSKIRDFYGFPVKRSLRGTKSNTPEGSLLKLSQEKIAKWDAAYAVSKSEKDFYTFKAEQIEQKILNAEAKHGIFTKKGEI